ncbi:exodeoxyribonuclease V subunit gamma [Neorhizobium sp. T786]|uniref:DUF6522 family protein n=1 Tax=Pseudorhizobium xiangyangii TaxID=2883104 RepID=UPI001D00088B|nr:DUF6522 family protein [Neorhizobium xiangyangii]MCB5204692.1 exodeoxyribonuclease V subunit gamma [Neorhizobium xiangyangii]
MQISRDANGDFVLASPELAARFGLSDEELRDRLRAKLVHSTVERGEGEDAQSHRLSVRLGNRMWRAILDSNNEVVEEELTFVRSSLSRR